MYITLFILAHLSVVLIMFNTNPSYSAKAWLRLWKDKLHHVGNFENGDPIFYSERTENAVVWSNESKRLYFKTRPITLDMSNDDSFYYPLYGGRVFKPFIFNIRAYLGYRNLIQQVRKVKYLNCTVYNSVNTKELHADIVQLNKSQTRKNKISSVFE
jgi:hypothetical protein